MVQFLLAHLPRQLYDLPSHPKANGQRYGINREYLDEDWCLRWWYHHRVLVSMGRPQTRYVCRCTHQRLLDSSLGSTRKVRESRSIWIHDPVHDTGGASIHLVLG